MIIKNVLLSSILAPAVLLTSCATIINGTTQQVCFTSEPSRANIWIDGCPIGQTPIAVHLSRSDNHIVHFELDGYLPFDMHVRKRMSKWVFGNLVFGGVIGLVIDLASGGIYKLTPEQVCVHLQECGKDPNIYAKNGYVGVVMTPDPSWEKIAQLTPAK
jgi:hypothetical protein